MSNLHDLYPYTIEMPVFGDWERYFAWRPVKSTKTSETFFLKWLWRRVIRFNNGKVVVNYCSTHELLLAKLKGGI